MIGRDSPQNLGANFSGYPFLFQFKIPYLMGPKSALFLRVALIKAGVRGAVIIRAIFERYHVFEKLSFSKLVY